MMERIIAHLDMDAFFASVEQVRKPWLKGKAIGVSNHPNGRSVIATASYEARVYGIKSGMPIKEALKKLPSLIIVKGDMNLYEEISDKIYEILKKYAPSIERFSIDEAFLDFSYIAKNYDNARTIALSIKEDILRQTQLTCTIGISYNKLVSKIASKQAKPDGLLIIKKEEAFDFLRNLNVSKIPGIGNKIEKKLKEHFNVITIEDLQKINLNELIRVFHSYGVFLYQSARGIDESKVIDEFEKKQEKSIGNSTTLDFDTDNIDIIKSVLKKISANVGFRLRSKNFLTTKILLTIRYEDFTTFSYQTTVHETNNDYTIYEASLKTFRQNYSGKKVRLLGITATNLKSNDQGLFNKSKTKEENILTAIDTIKKKFNDATISYADTLTLDTLFFSKKISGR